MSSDIIDEISQKTNAGGVTGTRDLGGHHT